MTPEPMTRAIKDIRQLVEAQSAGELTDRQLLARFAGQQDEAAFAQLVRRHGPMVLGVCLRVLRHRHDAEDAFQAAFLVLARKAASVGWQDSAGGWLFQVAYHLALKMRANAKRRHTCALPDVAGPDPGAGQPDWELRSILDEELSRLPQKYRNALLLCHYEGKTRAEAARQLGWKEGAVKIRLERGRELLRTRLTRRGLALSGLVMGTLLTESAAPAALPAALVSATVASAGLFALGKLPAAAAALAEGVLKTMLMTRLKMVALLVLAVSIVSLGVGLWAHRAIAEKPDGVVGPRQEVAREARPKPPAQAAEAPAPAKDPAKPLRVLLFAGAPTREYRFIRTLFVNQATRKQVELSICLQSGGPQVGIGQDVAPEHLLQRFPTRLSTDEKGDAEDRYGNLARYDVLIAFDPDWTQLTEKQGQLLEKWVGEQGHGLILVAGPINTFALARPASAQRFRPILNILPVRLEDSRVLGERDTSMPWPLAFPVAENFLKVDEAGKEPLSGWSEFFFGKERDDWQKTEDRPLRGFYTAYPVKGIKPAATILATFRDPQARIPAVGDKRKDLAYLVAMRYGKGRTVYLGSGETWRLRQFRDSFHERFWTQLSRYAASAGAAPVRKPGARAPEITPEQRQAINKGLAWLAQMQAVGGYWEAADEKARVPLTALAGMALLMQGSTIREGEYANPLRKAVDWLQSWRQPDGLIGNNKGVKGEKYVQGHGQALLFLASVNGEEEDRDRRRKLAILLTSAVEFAAEAQIESGGWGYLFRGLTKEGDGQADVATTALLLQALRAARNAGIAVPKVTISRGQRYLEKTVDPASPAVVVGLVGAFAPGDYQSALAKKWLNAAWKFAPVLDPKARPPDDQALSLYSFALVAHGLGENGHATVLPESKPGERITWGEYRKKVFDYLQKTQNADGSWGDSVRATALYLAILQLDNQAMPIQR
jgi:RNA polymerase sigma factor (sigma-70 family)